MDRCWGVARGEICADFRKTPEKSDPVGASRGRSFGGLWNRHFRNMRWPPVDSKYPNCPEDQRNSELLGGPPSPRRIPDPDPGGASGYSIPSKFREVGPDRHQLLSKGLSGPPAIPQGYGGVGEG